jgi:hypothetical protein
MPTAILLKIETMEESQKVILNKEEYKNLISKAGGYENLKKRDVVLTAKEYGFLSVKASLYEELKKDDKVRLFVIDDYDHWGDYGEIVYKNNEETKKEMRDVINDMIKMNNLMGVPRVTTKNWLEQLLSKI